ncbi:MAG TPA: hypothetical protein VGA49_03350 [Patescibacteria group bacterium]
MYECPSCGYTSDNPGDCPHCNVPLETVMDDSDDDMDDDMEDDDTDDGEM